MATSLNGLRRMAEDTRRVSTRCFVLSFKRENAAIASVWSEMAHDETFAVIFKQSSPPAELPLYGAPFLHYLEAETRRRDAARILRIPRLSRCHMQKVES